MTIIPTVTTLLLSLLLLYTCSPSARFSSQNNSKDNFKNSRYQNSDVIYGEASYYADKFHGRKTANGEIFDMYKLTAAHKSLPFDTILEVTNQNNGKSVVVRVNDRGPYKKGRILDLSYAAAKSIDMISTGVARVQIKILKLFWRQA